MNERLIAETGIVKVYEKDLTFDNGQAARVEYVSLFDDTLDVTMIAALTDTQELLFIEQFWPAMDKKGLILPGGRVDPGETPETGAARELAEETGYFPIHLRRLITVDILPKYLYGQTHFFLATGLRQTAEYIGDEVEEIKIKRIPLNQVVNNILQGQITDSRSVALSLLVYNRINH